MKKTKIIILVMLLGVLFTNVPSFAGEEMVVYHWRPESGLDTRFEYHIELLRTALEKTTRQYGPAKLEPAKDVMNPIRILKMLVNGIDGIDVAFGPTSSEYEKLLIPVRIPLDKGLLGYRIFLIHKQDQPRFSAITRLDELRDLKVGQGMGWNDVSIYEHNHFTVITGSTYEGLFEMLLKGRFDYFARGVEEAYPEYAARKDTMPDLHVEESIVLYYPFPRYFWVSNNEKGEILRERLTTGMEMMIQDGTFDQIFRKYKGETIKRANLKNRTLFTIENPFLPETVPLDRPELWYDPFTE